MQDAPDASRKVDRYTLLGSLEPQKGQMTFENASVSGEKEVYRCRWFCSLVVVPSRLGCWNASQSMKHAVITHVVIHQTDCYSSLILSTLVDTDVHVRRYRIQ